MGIREANWPVAAIVLAVHLANILLGPSIFSVLFGVVLLSNLRATFLAAEWKPAEEGEDRPTRFDESLADKYIDQWPRLLWPRLQIVFWILGVSMLLLSMLGVGYTLAVRFGLLPHK